MSQRADRINEIPHMIMELKKEKTNAVKKDWIGVAAMLQKQITDLEKEFKEIYDSFGEKK